MGSRVLGWCLRLWALTRVLLALVWLLGPFGSGAVSGAFLGDHVVSIAGGPLRGLLTGPAFGAWVSDEGFARRVSDMSTELSKTSSGTLGGSLGDINLGWDVQFSLLTGLQGWAWTLLHVIPLLVLACLWWALAGVVSSGRRQSVFTTSNARKLTVAGFVVAVGAPAVSVATWGFRHWVTDTSNLADRIVLPAYSWHAVPWTAVAAGVALMVLGHVWRRGIVLENDLGGLV